MIDIEYYQEVSLHNTYIIYSAIWRDGPLHKKNNRSSYTRDSNKTVALKCFHNSQEFIDSLINEAKKYSTNYKAFQVLYGISQSPDTGSYILVVTCSSGNEKIDGFIQERQLKIDNYNDIYIQQYGRDGPLYKKYGFYGFEDYTRDSNKEVTLKCLHSSQESIDSLINETQRDYILVLNWTSGNENIDDFIQEKQLKINNLMIVLEWIPYHQFNEIKEIGKNSPYNSIFSNMEGWSIIQEAKKYPIKHKSFQVLYGISQNPDTGNYILVLIWTSGNEKIDNFIQERQLKITNNNDDIVLEWIPYNQFNEIMETGKNNLITVYSAIWKDESIDSLINEAKKYPIKHKTFHVLYGISQNPDTGDYIFVQSYTIVNLANWIILEWIPYKQFNEIKETGRDGPVTVYSAIWKDGPLLYKKYWQDENYTRDSNKKVALKCIHNSQESIDSLINETKRYSTKYKAFKALYGISQNPDTGDYILIHNSCIKLGKSD
ncbi:unnamed protein product [Rhizophagus irregularis]|nr:unnamed protein product [Rhizophagus irregularis]